MVRKEDPPTEWVLYLSFYSICFICKLCKQQKFKFSKDQKINAHRLFPRHLAEGTVKYKTLYEERLLYKKWKFVVTKVEE